MYYVEAMSKVNYHGDQVVRIGEYESLDRAIAAAEQVIDQFLNFAYHDGISAGALFVKYQNEGRVPFIFVDGGATINVSGFNHISYAKRRCEELCVFLGERR
jgi:hypothetical protein